MAKNDLTRSTTCNSRNELRRLNVSIVTYNTEAAELLPFINQIQQSDNINTIFVIDNSPNASLLAQLPTHSVYYHKTNENVGFGAAHNIALRESHRANIPFHLVLNPDVTLSSKIVDLCLEAIRARPDVALLMPHVMNPDGTTQKLAKLLPSPGILLARRLFGKLLPKRINGSYELDRYDYKAELDVPALSGCFMLMRTGAVASAGYFDERFFMYMEDFDLCRRLQSIGRTICWPKASITHQHDRGSYRNLSLLLVHARSAYIYFSKWGWFNDTYRRTINRSTMKRLGY